MLLLSLYGAAFSQGRTIRGTIVDEATGTPLAGVTVSVKGESASMAVTDSAGNFSIRTAAARPVLLFSSVGYTATEVRAGDATLRIGLKKEDKSLDEVIVVGYGTVKKRDLTGSVSTVKAADIVRSPTSNPLEAIQGMAPGVDITKQSGKAGAGVNIVIRGTRSINGSSTPLYVIDGIQGGDISTINPNDIESIEFLKDASSTAIYGSQGANGVVIVTTKHGNAGKAKINYNGYVGVDGWAQYPQPRTRQSYIDLRRQAYADAGIWNSPADDTKAFNTSELAAISAGQWVNWIDQLEHNGIRQSHSISVAGGSEKTRTYLSTGYYRDNGMVRFNNLTQYNALMNVEHTLNSRIKVGMQAAYVYSNSNTRGTDPFSHAATAEPLGTPRDSTGAIVVYPIAGNPGFMSPLSDDRGPYIATNNTIRSQVTLNAHVDVELVKGLVFKTVFGTNIYNYRTGQFYDSSSLEEQSLKQTVATINTGNTRFYNWDNILSYTKSIGDHSFTITGLTSYTRRNVDSLLASGTGLAFSSQLFYNLAGTSTTGRTITSGFLQANTMSYAGRINYGYKGRYLLTLTERVDGASLLSAGHKWAGFPSVAAAWRISDESFMEHVNAVTNLKLRASYGWTGNSGIAVYGTQTALMTQNMGFENSAAQAYVISSLIGNQDVKWELSKTANIGIDADLLKSRISLSLDIYNTNTSRILLLRSLPPSLGVGSVYQNVGNTRNRGIELGMTTRNIDNRSFKWSTTWSFMSNQEKITGLINGKNIIATSGPETNSLLLGHAVHSFYVYKKLGIWQTSEADKAAALSYGGTPFKPGDIRLADINHDGKISQDSDYSYIGQAAPKWSLGLQNTFVYKNFDLTIYAIVRWGQMIKADFLGRYNPTGQGDNGPGYFQYWTPQHATNDYPEPNSTKPITAYPGYLSLIYVDGSYAKLKTATLGYTVPASMLKKAFMSNLRAYVTCNNIFVKAKSHLIKDYDPERGGSEDAPLTRQLVFGLNVGF